MVRACTRRFVCLALCVCVGGCVRAPGPMGSSRRVVAGFSRTAHVRRHNAAAAAAALCLPAAAAGLGVVDGRVAPSGWLRGRTAAAAVPVPM
jgi:hypothetical protein